jgi:hypothetical protein
MSRKVALAIGIVISAIFLFFFVGGMIEDVSRHRPGGLSLRGSVLLGFGPFSFLFATLLAFWRKAEAIAASWLVIGGMIGSTIQVVEAATKHRPSLFNAAIVAIVVFYAPMVTAGILLIHHAHKPATEPTDSDGGWWPSKPE